KWVLIGFGILYLVFVLSFIPTDKILPRPIEESWELVRDILWAGMTIISIGLLEVMSPLATPFASASGLRRCRGNLARGNSGRGSRLFSAAPALQGSDTSLARDPHVFSAARSDAGRNG